MLTCFHPDDGGFGASPRNDSHLLATLSAVQILALLDELHRIDTDKVVACECAWASALVVAAYTTQQQQQQAVMSDETSTGVLSVSQGSLASSVLCVCCVLWSAACVMTDIAGLQQPDGSFAGDKWGEIDTRCA